MFISKMDGLCSGSQGGGITMIGAMNRLFNLDIVVLRDYGGGCSLASWGRRKGGEFQWMGLKRIGHSSGSNLKCVVSPSLRITSN